MRTLKRIYGVFFVTVDKELHVFGTLHDALKYIDKER